MANLGDIAPDAVVNAAKATPPVLVTGASLLGYTLQDWAYFLTALYTALLIADWLWKKAKLWLASRKPDPSDKAGA